MQPTGLSRRTQLNLFFRYLLKTVLLCLPVLLTQAAVIALMIAIVRSGMTRAGKILLSLADLLYGESAVYLVWMKVSEKLTNYAGFRQKIAQSTENPKWQKELLENDKNEDVRAAATAQAGGWKRLTDVALNDCSDKVRLAATERIWGADEAETLLRASGDPRVRECAVLRIRDDALLRELALNDPAKAVRITAMEHIESPEILRELVSGANDEDVWRACLPKLMLRSMAGGSLLPETAEALRSAAGAEKLLKLRVCPRCFGEVIYHQELTSSYDSAFDYEEDEPYMDLYTCQHCCHEVEDEDFSLELCAFLPQE